MRVAVVDGQGGGIGRLIVEKLRSGLGANCTIIGLGTNALATSAMLKAGANEGASGENAVIFNVSRADVVVGSIAIIAANSFSGELSPGMATAIAASTARKILLPINRSAITVCGVVDEPLPIQVDKLVDCLKQIYDETY